MHHGGDFVIDPLPNLLFTRDSSVWIGAAGGDHVAGDARPDPRDLADRPDLRPPPAVPRRPAGLRVAVGAVEGGDVLLLAPGVVAVGVGERTTPAGAEALARSCSTTAWRTPCWPCRSPRSARTMHLDTVCTMVDVDAVVMYPNIADSLSAFTIHRTGDGGVDDRRRRAVPRAAAKAMGIDKLRVIDTGLDPVTAEREQWDDGNNTLALAPGVVVAYERNVETNARLRGAGIEVMPIAGSELGTGRGGPRCMSCPVARDPL